MVYVIKLTMETQEDADAALRVLEEALEEGEIENAFDAQVEESLNNFA